MLMDQLSLSHSFHRCPGIPQTAADEGDGPGSVTRIICRRRFCERPQLPHPPRRGVHPAPVILECRLSAPPSTKETLTAINYHTGRTRGLPPGCSSDLCLHTQTPPGLRCFPACLTSEPPCFVLLGVAVGHV